jgi:hypothetical protein
VGAKDAFYRALEQLSSFEHKNDSREVVKQHLEQAQKAAVELRTAWDDARKDSDPLFQEDCDRGFEVAEANVQNVTLFITPQ